MMDDQIHWFSIINSLMIVLFLSGMVAMIMMRTLHRDISKYNQLETADEAQEETGWKLVSLECAAVGSLSGRVLHSRLALHTWKHGSKAFLKFGSKLDHVFVSVRGLHVCVLPSQRDIGRWGSCFG